MILNTLACQLVRTLFYFINSYKFKRDLLTNLMITKRKTGSYEIFQIHRFLSIYLVNIQKRSLTVFDYIFNHITTSRHLMLVLLRFNGDLLTNLTMAKLLNKHCEICQMYLYLTIEAEISIIQ